MVRGTGITNSMSSLLYRTAMQMVQEKKSSKKFKGGDCQGVLSTEWKYAGMGTISGLQFSAKVESAAGTTEVTFIIRSLDLDEPDDDSWEAVPDQETFDRYAVADALEERDAIPRSRLN
ncbi:MAG TPA: hypothetical protein VHD55_01440 [Candidatus Paceibacterota bacterium]|nr:hypothetical protein [Candidatus Paceibacterota bacterium]